MENPDTVCVLPDSTILIGDAAENGRVSRYKVTNSDLIELWKSPQIPDPTGISYDERSEVIYICTLKGPLFLLSLDGTQSICILYFCIMFQLALLSN